MHTASERRRAMGYREVEVNYGFYLILSDPFVTLSWPIVVPANALQRKKAGIHERYE